MPCLRQMSETVSPLARSRSASRSNRATSSAFLRLLMGPSWAYSTRRLPFRLDQFLGGRPVAPGTFLKVAPPSALTCHCTVGAGLPAAAATKDTVLPALTLWLVG